MNIFSQLAFILILWAIGEYISSFINGIIVIPGSIVAMIILFLLLQFKIIKLEKISEISDLLLGNMAIFFVPAGVSLINSLDLIKENSILLITTIIISTIVVMYTTGYVSQRMIMKKNGGKKNV